MLYVCIKYTSADRGSIAILSFLLLNRRNQFFIVAQNIYECYGRVWQQMLFERHEFFRTVPDRCFRFTFISDSENHESHDKVSFIFSMSAKFFLWIWGVVFLKFGENYKKKTAWWGLYATRSIRFVTPQVSGAKTFYGKLFGIAKTSNQ